MLSDTAQDKSTFLRGVLFQIRNKITLIGYYNVVNCLIIIMKSRYVCLLMRHDGELYATFVDQTTVRLLTSILSNQMDSSISSTLAGVNLLVARCSV